MKNGKFLKMVADFLDGKGISYPESVDEIVEFAIFAQKYLNIPDLVIDAIAEMQERCRILQERNDEAIKRIASLERNCFHG